LLGSILIQVVMPLAFGMPGLTLLRLFVVASEFGPKSFQMLEVARTMLREVGTEHRVVVRQMLMGVWKMTKDVVILKVRKSSMDTMNTVTNLGDRESQGCRRDSRFDDGETHGRDRESRHTERS
jgi:hypothetical protein